MRIFLYSDLHISKSSSILPNSSLNDKYTFRQNMIIETGKFLASIIDEYKPDCIINLGDTFDQHTITSYDIDVASEFFKCFRYFNIPHLVLVGNHEMVNYNFNAIKILSNIDNITVISEPCVVSSDLAFNTNEHINLAFLPYMEQKDILEFPQGDFLFSHIDIQGSKIRGNVELQDGATEQDLSKYKIVFNGHIHKSSVKSNVVNVGSITTHSFADDSECVPQCYIFDTQTLDFKAFKSNICPLFRQANVSSVEELDKYLQHLDKSFKYILHVTCPYDIKQDVKELLHNSDLVLNNRLSINTENKCEDPNNQVNQQIISDNIDVKQSFLTFLSKCDDLKYPKSLYETVLEGVSLTNGN